MDPDHEGFKEFVREEFSELKYWALDDARKETKRLSPVIQGILREADELGNVNPSACVVWTVQALEVFLRDGILTPFIHGRLGHDTELADEISGRLFGRNGAKVAKEWLNEIFPIKFAEHLLESGQASIWNDLWSGKNETIIDWRDRIIHRGYVATYEEAKKAIEVVGRFISSIEQALRAE